MRLVDGFYYFDEFKTIKSQPHRSPPAPPPHSNSTRTQPKGTSSKGRTSIPIFFTFSDLRLVDGSQRRRLGVKRESFFLESLQSHFSHFGQFWVCFVGLGAGGFWEFGTEFGKFRPRSSEFGIGKKITRTG